MGRNCYITPEMRDIIVENYISGQSMSKCAKEFGVGTALVLGELIKRKIPRRKSRDYYLSRFENENFFENIDSEEKAYWLGFIGADGCVLDYNKRSEKQIEIRLSIKDKAHLTKFLSHIGLKCSIRIAKHQLCVVTVCSNIMFNHLGLYGITPRKSLTYVPVLPEQCLQRHFWRGMIDGDGTVFKNKHDNTRHIIGLTGTKIACDMFLEFVNKNIITTKTQTKKIKNKNVYSIRFSGNRVVKSIITYLYKYSTVYLDRKYLLYQKLSSIKTRKTYKDFTNEEIIEGFKQIGARTKLAKHLGVNFYFLRNKLKELKLIN